MNSRDILETKQEKMLQSIWDKLQNKNIENDNSNLREKMNGAITEYVQDNKNAIVSTLGVVAPTMLERMESKLVELATSASQQALLECKNTLKKHRYEKAKERNYCFEEGKTRDSA